MNELANLHLMRPEWLWALVPAAALALWLWRQRGRGGSWSDVIAPELLSALVGTDAAPRRANPLPLLLLAWVLAAVAAAGPSWEKIPQPVHQKQDALVLVLDLSYSMKAGDLAPSRLDRARQKLLDLLDLRREGQTALVAYAGDAHIVTPLTDDNPTIANLLPALNPDMMPVPGSNPAAGVQQALGLLRSAGIRRGRILLVTDGVDPEDAAALERVLAGSSVDLAVMGVGTATGAPIPLPRGGFLKDGAGAIVMPGLEEGALRALADASGGRYQRMQIDDSDLGYLLADRLLPDGSQLQALERTADTWEDRGHLLVLALLPLALALFRRGWLLCLLPLLAGLPGQPVHAGPWDDLWLRRDQQGLRALERGDAEATAGLFDDADWAGTAAYRGGNYEAASDHFSRNASADGWYNRGNALAHAGRFDEAMAAYRESLALEPGRRDAQENLALLESLLQQQQPPPPQGQSQDQEGQGQQQEQAQRQDPPDPQQGESGDPSADRSGQQDGQPEQGPEDDREQAAQPPEGGQDQQQAQQQNDRGYDEDAGREQPGEPPRAAQRDAGGSPPQPPPGLEEKARASLADSGEQEREQAVEQWLRRIPDDPSGLLREKFRYESRRRQQQGGGKPDETIW